MLRPLQSPWRLARFARRRTLDSMDVILNIRWLRHGKFTVQVEDSDRIHFHKQFLSYKEAMKGAEAAFKAPVEDVQAAV